MTSGDSNQGVQSVYNLWLDLIPQFLAQLGGAGPGVAGEDGTPGASSRAPQPSDLNFPTDQIAKAAEMTQQSVQAMAQSFPALLQAGGMVNLLSQWATASAAFAAGKPGEAAPMVDSATRAMLAPWAALMSNAASAVPLAKPGASTVPAREGLDAQVSPLQAMTQVWADMANQLTGPTPAQLNTAFDRTHGALADALGFAPLRELSTTWKDAVAASMAQQEARANYASLVQGAFAQGFQRLVATLAEKANAGERIDSALALLRLWATHTEEVVHETLQSERGLAATAALTRSILAYRRRMQRVAAVAADLLNIATRGELDEAYREIQTLKRELRRLRPERKPADVPAKRAGASAVAMKGGRSKRKPMKNSDED